MIYDCDVSAARRRDEEKRNVEYIRNGDRERRGVVERDMR